MQGSVGEKIGEGKFADVHFWAPGQVLKLWKAGVRQRTVSHEARMIRAVFAAGVAGGCRSGRLPPAGANLARPTASRFAERPRE